MQDGSQYNGLLSDLSLYRWKVGDKHRQKNYEAILQITKIDLTSEEASDQEPPIIELAGEQNIILFQNDEFVDPGIKQIIDNQDGNISADNVSIRYEYYDGTTHENVSHVDTSRIGFFYIYYTVKDKASNETQAIRVVTVQVPDSENRIPRKNQKVLFYQKCDMKR